MANYTNVRGHMRKCKGGKKIRVKAHRRADK